MSQSLLLLGNKVLSCCYFKWLNFSLCPPFTRRFPFLATGLAIALLVCTWTPTRDQPYTASVKEYSLSGQPSQDGLTDAHSRLVSQVQIEKAGGFERLVFDVSHHASGLLFVAGFVIGQFSSCRWVIKNRQYTSISGCTSRAQLLMPP
ncbi:hypothetical protein [Larkinella sp. C7]|uniref:hypothetical protein n=1 Tax=Larkinella sp. C7 TaxID=2576607 RepID=UPI0011112C25|nr:hypothetical protein [Larkinella sp. C7]